MAKPHREREFSADRGTPHGGTFGGQLDSETRLHPFAYVSDEELLVCRETLRVEHRRVLVEPSVITGTAVDTDDHRGRRVRRLEGFAQPPDMPSTVCGEDDGAGRSRRDVHRDLAAAVVRERLGDELSSCWRHSHGPTARARTAGTRR